MTESWTPYKLRQICTLLNGRAYRKSELLSEGKYPVLRVGNFFTNTNWYYSDLELGTDKYCDDDDLLYAWSASFGPRIWSGGRVIFHYHIWKVLPDMSLIDKKFLYWWFLWDADLIKAQHGAGTTMTHVAKGSMDERDVRIPALSEQRRIAGVLDEAFDGIAVARANAKKNLRNARALFDSHLDSIYANRSDGWVERRLKEVCEKITDGTHQTPTYYDDGIVFLSSRNVTSGTINWENIKYIDTGQHEEMQRRVSPRRNDILLAKNGTTGVAAIVDRDTPFDIYVSLALLRARDEVSPRFLLHFINSPVAKRQFNKRLKGIGVPNLHLEEIREVVIAFPPSLTEQESIVAKVDALTAEIQRLLAILRLKVARLDVLEKSLLHQAFTGKL